MCDKPFIKYDDNNNPGAYSCGQCYPCIVQRASGWSFRLIKQGEVSSLSLFVTLTYNTEHVPMTKRGFMSLSRDTKKWNPRKKKYQFVGSDLTNFFKKVRKLNQEKIVYYATGEYGGKTWRPHYHIILYNASIQSCIDAWQDIKGQPLGDIYFGTVEGASIGYVLKYITKVKQIPLHENDDRVPEYCRMSKGIGKHYLTEKNIKWHKADLPNRQYLPGIENEKYSLPRYFRKVIYNDQEKGFLKGENERHRKEKQEAELAEFKDQYNHIVEERKKDNWRKLREKRHKNKNDLL